MSAIDQDPFPRSALIATAALLGLTLVSTAAVRVWRISAPQVSSAAAPAPSALIDLQFKDEADGSIAVRQSGTQRLIATLPPGQDGFVRGVMRGLARDRISRKIGQDIPFRVAQARDGALTLEDLATGRRIDLQSFGVDNRASFLRFLPAAAPPTPGARR
jgi:putative photosynthetic complex assembly protein